MATKKTTTKKATAKAAPKSSPKSAKSGKAVVKKETRNRVVYTTYSDGTTEGKPIRRAGASVGTPKKTAVQKAAESAQKKVKVAKYKRAVEKEVNAKATPVAREMNKANKKRIAKEKLKKLI